MSNPVYRRAVELMEAELGEELVALDADAGSCFGFNDVATSVWRRLAKPAASTGFATPWSAEYDVSEDQCTAELRGLLDDLVERGLIRIVSDRPTTRATTG